MPYMYILECADGSYYTGSTWDLERRLQEHQSGLGARHTAKRLPVKLVYCECYERIEDAFRREKQVQGWSRRKKQALVEQNYDKLVEYSRNYTQNPPATSITAASTSSAAAEGPLLLNILSNSLPEPLPKPLPELVEGNGEHPQEAVYDR